MKPAGCRCLRVAYDPDSGSWVCPDCGALFQRQPELGTDGRPRRSAMDVLREIATTGVPRPTGPALCPDDKWQGYLTALASQVGAVMDATLFLLDLRIGDVERLAARVAALETQVDRLVALADAAPTPGPTETDSKTRPESVPEKESRRTR